MEVFGDSVIYNADDEEPDCNMCENACNDKYCSLVCGAEHGWYRYRRTEHIGGDEL